MTTPTTASTWPLRPQVDELTAPFYSAAANGRLVIPRCVACGRFCWTPRPMCPHCRAQDFDWKEVEPHGTVWSFCVVHPPVLPELQDRTPFAVLLVSLREDPAVRLVGDLVGTSSDHIRIDQAVEAVFEQIDNEVGIVHWRITG